MKDTLDQLLKAEFKNPFDSSWRVYDCGVTGGCFELSGYSPEGENITITLRGQTLAQLAADANEAWENFDADEHAAEILCAKRSGDENARRFYKDAPDSLRELLTDARAIKRMHKRVFTALKKAAKKEGVVS